MPQIATSADISNSQPFSRPSRVVPCYSRILSLFDELVEAGILVYDQCIKRDVVDKGLRVEFVVTQTIVSKFSKERTLKLEADTPPHELHHRPKCFGPGSDIAFEDGRILLAMPSDTHLLVFNKFPVFRPQFLLLTVDSYRRQDEPLDVGDLNTAYGMLQSFKAADRDHYAFYNCCREAGSSRDHKHIQIIPKTMAMFPDQPQCDPGVIPFKHFLERLDPSAASVKDDIVAAYAKISAQSKTCLGLPLDAAVYPHNVLFTLDWFLVIPRRSAAHIPVPTPNSAGMMGSVWLPDVSNIEMWRSYGPRRILTECGVAN